jgi:threonine synthase
MARIAFLECAVCGNRISADEPQTVCPIDAGSLMVRYDLESLKKTAKRENVAAYAAAAKHSLGMWRYADVLPDVTPVTLGEGFTPLLQSKRYDGLTIKEEAANPTGTFKARGMAAAVTMAKHYGLKHLTAPSAGNAAGALAAYCAAAGITAHIFMPKDVPFANILEARAYGADLTLVDGLISDCGRMVAERVAAQKKLHAEGELPANEVWFEVSTMKEPFRVEGKKTMGYELVEQLGWEYPDAVFYPTGGGVGLIGMWKAFEEMEALGWVKGKRPKMYALQAAGCAPLAKAFAEGKERSEFFTGAATEASGLRVPKPYADWMVLKIVRESGGEVVAVDDKAIFGSIADWSKQEGLLLCPEGAAATASYDKLLAEGKLKASDRVVLFNTGAGLKYVDTIAEAWGIRRQVTLPTSLPVGGIITPV